MRCALRVALWVALMSGPWCLISCSSAGEAADSTTPDTATPDVGGPGGALDVAANDVPARADAIDGTEPLDTSDIAQEDIAPPPKPPEFTFPCDLSTCHFPQSVGCTDFGFDCFFERGEEQAACEAANHGYCMGAGGCAAVLHEGGEWYTDCCADNGWGRLVATSHPNVLICYSYPTDG